MARKITSEERRILLENPELVMFDPSPALNTSGHFLTKAVLAAGAAAVCFLKPGGRMARTAEEDHYVRQLDMLLPEEPECRIVHILQVTYEKAEGVWLMNGTEELFGYSSYVNVFRIEPDTDLAVITDGTAFWAFVRRDPKTESFYE